MIDKSILFKIRKNACVLIAFFCEDFIAKLLAALSIESMSWSKGYDLALNMETTKRHIAN